MITPGPEKILQMNSEINRRLTEAFCYLISDVLERPDVTAISSCSPSAHSLQFLMREAATVNDVQRIRSLFDQHGHILSEEISSSRCEILPLNDAFMHPSKVELFCAAFQDDIGLTTALLAPSSELVSDFNNQFSQIQSLLQQQLPKWWAEFENLVQTIFLATAKENRFGGASAFSAWGSILVNPTNCTSVLGTALTIIHESSTLNYSMLI